MKRYTKKVYYFAGPPPVIQGVFQELAQSDQWGTQRSCLGCLGGLLGLGGLVASSTGISAPGVMAWILLMGGIAAFFYYNEFNTEDRRYQLPEQVVSALSQGLDGSREVQMTLDFRETASKPFLRHTSQVQDGKITEYHQTWLELQMWTQIGQHLALKIERILLEKVCGQGKQQKVERPYYEVASLSVENPRLGQTAVFPLELPDSSYFQNMLGGSNTRSVAIRVTGNPQGSSGSLLAFEGEQLVELLKLAVERCR